MELLLDEQLQVEPPHEVRLQEVPQLVERHQLELLVELPHEARPQVELQDEQLLHKLIQ